MRTLQELRKLSGLTKKRFADALCVSTSKLDNMEQGRTSPGIYLIKATAIAESFSNAVKAMNIKG